MFFWYVFIHFVGRDALEIGMQGMHGLETNCSNGAPEAGDQFANGQIICSLIFCIMARIKHALKYSKILYQYLFKGAVQMVERAKSSSLQMIFAVLESIAEI